MHIDHEHIKGVEGEVFCRKTNDPTELWWQVIEIHSLPADLLLLAQRGDRLNSIPIDDVAESIPADWIFDLRIESGCLQRIRIHTEEGNFLAKP